MGYHRAGFDVTGVDIKPSYVVISTHAYERRDSARERRRGRANESPRPVARLRRLRGAPLGLVAERSAAEPMVLRLWTHRWQAAWLKAPRATPQLEGRSASHHGWLYSGSHCARRSNALHGRRERTGVRASASHGTRAREAAADQRRSAPQERPKARQQHRKPRTHVQVGARIRAILRDTTVAAARGGVRA